jgi:protease PrsW
MSRERTVTGAEALLVGGLLAFVGIAYAAERVMKLDHPVRIPVLIAVVLAAAPALVWLTYFYLQDRLEPEPHHYVLGVYLLGGFVAAPLASFALSTAPPTALELHWYSAPSIIRALLLIAVAQELAKYIVVRFTIYLNPEFDEPIDGIVYMTAAGIGFATAVNIRYLQGLDNAVYLTIGATTAVVTTLAHACFAGFLGFFLGKARFTIDPMRRNLLITGGLVGAIVVNAGFSLAGRLVRAGSFRAAAWRNLVVAAAFAAVIFFIVSMLMRRSAAASEA